MWWICDHHSKSSVHVFKSNIKEKVDYIQQRKRRMPDSKLHHWVNRNIQ